MKRVFSLCIGAFLAGLGLGAIEAAKWLHALSGPSSIWREAFEYIRAFIWLPAALIVIGSIISGYSIACTLAPQNKVRAVIKALIAAALAFVFFWVIVRLSAVFYLAPGLYIPIFAFALALCVALMSYMFTQPWIRNLRSSVIYGVVTATVWSALIIILRISIDHDGNLSFGGLRTFAVLSYLPELRTYPGVLSDLAGGVLCGLFIGIATAKVFRKSLRNGALLGAIGGGWVSASFYAAHSMVGTLIMQSAYSERIAFYSSLGLIPLAAVVAAIGVIAILPGIASSAQKVTAVSLGFILLAAAAVYIADSRAGSGLYIAAVNSHPLKTRAYIHFFKDGGWRRTFEPHDDSHKIELCDRLLEHYPRSIYSAHALYLKARCLYASWKFQEAAESLEHLRNRYRNFKGSASVLLAHSYLAQGYYERVVQGLGWNDPVFTRWRSGDGGLLLGYASEVIGSEQDALGKYTYYVVNLTASKKSAWASSALQYAESRVDRVRRPPVEPMPRAIVRGRVVSQGTPLPGIHIALVHPHIDASSPDDTRQFTGALTVPLWFGVGATTDENGIFEIKNIPFGDYDVVVGFDILQIPADSVISKAVSGVRVESAVVEMPEINFVPSIALVTPVDGVTTDNSPFLSWSAHPGAAFYTVSIISRPGYSLDAPSSKAAAEGYQCWMRSNITGTSVKVTQNGFISDGKSEESKIRSLVPGRCYSWIVFACDNKGNIISSSERYRTDREPVFFVKPDDTKGG